MYRKKEQPTLVCSAPSSSLLFSVSVTSKSSPPPPSSSSSSSSSSSPNSNFNSNPKNPLILFRGQTLSFFSPERNRVCFAAQRIRSHFFSYDLYSLFDTDNFDFS